MKRCASSTACSARRVAALTGTLLAISAAGAKSQCITPPAGLASWWRAEGNALDSIGPNHGMLSGGLSFAAGQFGQAFHFTADGQVVTVPASASLNVGAGAGFTIEGWINPDNATTQMPIAEWNTGGNPAAHFWISVSYAGFGGPGSIYASLHGGIPGIFATGPGVIQAGVWQHVAMTWDRASGAVRLYRNGIQVASTNLSGQVPVTSPNLYLGARPGGPSFRGKLDEISLYNRAFSAQEIQAVYGAGKCVPRAPFFHSPDEPTDTNVLQCRTLTLVSTPDGQPTPALQWYKDGVPIDPASNNSATNPTYASTNFQAFDAGQYFVEARSPLGVARSRTAIVGYIPDTAPPVVTSAIAKSDGITIVVTFNEAVGGPDIFYELHYQICPNPDTGGDCLQHIVITMPSPTTLIFTTEPRDPNLSYKLSLLDSAVQDDCPGNSIPDNITVPVISLPTLTITRLDGQVVLSWSAVGPVFRLQSANALPASNTWTTVPGTPVLSGGTNRITNSISGAQKFYRLISP